MAQTIQLRRGTAAQWAAANPTLAAGEMGLVTDLQAFKIGDGVTPWNSLSGPSQPSGVTYIDAGVTAETVSMPAPAAGQLRVYAKRIANRSLLRFVGQSGLDTAVQPILARNKIGMFCPPGNATTATTMGAYTAPTAVGTATARNVTTTNLFTRMRRLGYVSAATDRSLAGARVAAAQVTVGGSGGTGFFKIIRFGISDASVVAAARMFVGVAASTAAPTNVEPATLVNCIGVGCGAADSNLRLFYGGSTAQTPIDLGSDFPANTTNTDVYELALFAPPDTADVHWQVKRLNTGDVASGTLASSGGVALPGTTTLLTYLQAWRSNNATVAAVGLDIMSDYIETDY